MARLPASPGVFKQLEDTGMVPARSGGGEVVAMDGERAAEEPAAATRSGASRSHSEAERKRRQRINAHLATLRSLLPSASQMDKAALLGEVVRHVRELRDGAAAGVAVPGESDEVGVEEEYWDAGARTKRVRAWVCCTDRPGLMSDVGRAVRSANARAVRAEIATVGGRTRSNLELDVGQAALAAGATSRPALQAALRAVLFSREELLAVESHKRQHFSAVISKV